MWDPSGWAVCGLATKVVTWLLSLCLDPYWAKWAIGMAKSNQSAGYVKS